MNILLKANALALSKMFTFSQKEEDICHSLPEQLKLGP
jgi:hypothetical protein